MKASCGGRGRIACLSRMLRRILCFRNLPLRSFDHFPEDERDRTPVPTQGVVARLMGLDSAPLPLVQSADQFKTSRSRPRDIPPYQELHDDKFFILSFEKRRHTNSTTLHHTPKSKKKIPNESETSSPNSVLQFVGFSADQDSVSSGEMGNSKTRRPLSEELESCGDSDGQNVVIHPKPNHALKLGGIGDLAAAETVGSTWLHHHNHTLLEIGRDVASSIFDHLLEEIVLHLPTH